MMCNEHAYCLAIEKLLGIEVPIRAQYIRVMFDEITRMLNHLMWLGAHALDVGAMAMFLYCVPRARRPDGLYEAVSGARMHAAYYRPGGVYRDLPDAMPQYQASKIRSAKAKIAHEREPRRARCSTSSRTSRALSRLRRRIRDAADRQPHLEAAHGRHRRGLAGARAGLGFTGPMLRGSGIEWDLRKKQPYEVYDRMDFDIPVGVNGDCYDRYLVRIEEMRQSNRIIKQCIDWLRNNPGPGDDRQPQGRAAVARRDEDQHGRADPPLQALHRRHPRAARARRTPRSSIRRASSASTSISDGANKPYRLKIRAPGFRAPAALDEMARGHMIADVVAIIGTQDIVFGEIDR